MNNWALDLLEYGWNLEQTAEMLNVRSRSIGRWQHWSKCLRRNPSQLEQVHCRSLQPLNQQGMSVTLLFLP